MVVYLILGCSYGFAAEVQPGPFQTYLISQTIINGWRRTIPAAFAPLLSDGPIIALVLLVLVRMPPWLVQILQCAGGLFLLYLAWGAFRTWKNFDFTKPAESNSSGRTVFRAVLVNMLNPAPYIAWSLIMGPLLLKGWREAPVNGIALLTGFYASMVGVTLGVMLLFSSARKFGARFSRALVGISTIILVVFSLYEIWQGTGAHWIN